MFGPKRISVINQLTKCAAAEFGPAPGRYKRLEALAVGPAEGADAAAKKAARVFQISYSESDPVRVRIDFTSIRKARIAHADVNHDDSDP